MEKSVNNKTAFCRNHPTSIVEKDPIGNYYTFCRNGYKYRELCSVVIEEKKAVGNIEQQRAK